MTIHQFIEYLPNRAVPEALEGEQVRFHFNISGDEGGAYTVAIDDGKMNIEEGLQGDADCVISAKDQHFSDLLTRKLNPMMAVITGKLKLSNQAVMLKYAKRLGLM